MEIEHGRLANLDQCDLCGQNAAEIALGRDSDSESVQDAIRKCISNHMLEYALISVVADESKTKERTDSEQTEQSKSSGSAVERSTLSMTDKEHGFYFKNLIHGPLVAEISRHEQIVIWMDSWPQDGWLSPDVPPNPPSDPSELQTQLTPSAVYKQIGTKFYKYLETREEVETDVQKHGQADFEQNRNDKEKGEEQRERANDQKAFQEQMRTSLRALGYTDQTNEFMVNEEKTKSLPKRVDTSLIAEASTQPGPSQATQDTDREWNVAQRTLTHEPRPSSSGRWVEPTNDRESRHSFSELPLLLWASGASDQLRTRPGEKVVSRYIQSVAKISADFKIRSPTDEFFRQGRVSRLN